MEGSGRITAELLSVQYTVAQRTVKNNFKALFSASHHLGPPFSRCRKKFKEIKQLTQGHTDIDWQHWAGTGEGGGTVKAGEATAC